MVSVNSIPELGKTNRKLKPEKSLWISAGENPSGAQQCRFGDGYGTPSLSKRLPKNGTNIRLSNPLKSPALSPIPN